MRFKKTKIRDKKATVKDLVKAVVKLINSIESRFDPEFMPLTNKNIS